LELVRLNQSLISNKNVVEVLDSFNLTAMLDITFLNNFLNTVSGEIGQAELMQFYDELARPWRQMMVSLPSWQNLTAPIELLETKKHNDLITLNIKQSKDDATTIELISEVLVLFEKSYLTIADR